MHTSIVAALHQQLSKQACQCAGCCCCSEGALKLQGKLVVCLPIVALLCAVAQTGLCVSLLWCVCVERGLQCATDMESVRDMPGWAVDLCHSMKASLSSCCLVPAKTGQASGCSPLEVWCMVTGGVSLGGQVTACYQ